MTAPETIDRVERALVAAVTYTLKRPERLVYRIAGMGEDEDSPDYHAWYSVHRMPIRNIRSAASKLSLDDEGFILCHSQSRVSDFYDSDKIRSVYEPEVQNLIKQHTGARRVIVFDHTIRVESDDARREKKVREPVKIAHNDYTLKSGPERAHELLGPDAVGDRLTGRFAFYNLWRPIVEPVISAPLALCDAHSVDSQDWVLCDLAYEDRIGEIYNLAFNPNHRWCYFPSMAIDEVVMFKSYDSAEDGRARFTPHTAFEDPNTPPGAPSRESIESRVLALFAPDLE